MENWMWVILGLIVIGIIVLISGLVTICPNCNKWWGRKSEGRKELDRQDGYKTVIRYDIRRNSKGEEIGRTEREEQVHVTRVKYLNYWTCKNCRHNWTTISTSEYEG